MWNYQCDHVKRWQADRRISTEKREGFKNTMGRIFLRQSTRGDSRLRVQLLSERGGANVWSAALLQAEREVGKAIRANVFGLCWRTTLSGPRWDALRSVPI